MNDQSPVAIVLGSACGDALGAGYEYGSAPLPAPGERTRMLGGGLGGFAPYEWTDDTSMAVPILQAAAVHRRDLGGLPAREQIADGFLAWAATEPPDMGTHTRAVMHAARVWSRMPGSVHSSAETLARAASDLSHGRASNGALMRTAPAVLPFLNDASPSHAVTAAARIAALTHAQPDSVGAVGVWVTLLWAAARGQSVDQALAWAVEYTPNMLREDGYEDTLDEEEWRQVFDAAVDGTLADLAPTGSAVGCLQHAWRAAEPSWRAMNHPSVAITAITNGQSPYVHVVETAIGFGGDTDTVAAVVGGLAGAVFGLDAIPAEWRERAHGYPGLTGADLADLAAQAVASH